MTTVSKITRQNHVVENCHYQELGHNARLTNCPIVNLKNQSLVLCKFHASMAFRAIKLLQIQQITQNQWKMHKWNSMVHGTIIT